MSLQAIRDRLAEATGPCNCPGDYAQFCGDEQHNDACPKSHRYNTRFALDDVATLLGAIDSLRLTLSKTEDERDALERLANPVGKPTGLVHREWYDRVVAERDAARADAGAAWRARDTFLGSLDIVRAERDAARAVLREVEWSGTDSLRHGDCCPWCRGLRGAHRPDCALAAAKGGER